MYQVLGFCDMPALLAAAAVSPAWRAAATADSTWARFNVFELPNIYQHLIEALSSVTPLERRLWTTPETDWAQLLWDVRCDPTDIQKWSPYTQLLLVSGRYRYDIFERQVTNRKVIELAIYVPLTYQHYAAFEDRALLLKSIQNRLPEHILRQYFEPYDDDYEVQMAVASFHGEFYYNFTEGRRELLLAALASAPTRPPARLARTRINDLELLRATTQVWDYAALYLDLSPALRSNPEAWQFCGPKLVEDRTLETFELGDFRKLLACYKRSVRCWWVPLLYKRGERRFSVQLTTSVECMLELCTLHEHFVRLADHSIKTVGFWRAAIKRNPNVWGEIEDGQTRRTLYRMAARQSYSLALKSPHLLSAFEQNLAMKPRRFARNRDLEERVCRADYGSCIYRNRIAGSEAEHRSLQKNQHVLRSSVYWAQRNA